MAPLYGSVNPEVHHPVQQCAEFLADLSYLGTYSEDRRAVSEYIIERMLSAGATRICLVAGVLR